MKVRILIAVGLSAIAVAAFNPTAGAQDITIDTGGVAYGSEGDRILIAEQDVDAALVGQVCDVTVTAANNDSAHPDNNIIITTAGASYLVPDVEASAGDVSTVAGSGVIGDSLRVELEFGPDGVTSGGLILTFDCAEPELPETTPDEPTPEEPSFTG